MVKECHGVCDEMEKSVASFWNDSSLVGSTDAHLQSIVMQGPSPATPRLDGLEWRILLMLGPCSSFMCAASPSFDTDLYPQSEQVTIGRGLSVCFHFMWAIIPSLVAVV